MKLLLTPLVAIALLGAALAQEPATPATSETCSPERKNGLPPCPITPRDRKNAEREFKEGVKRREKGKLAEALEHFKLATQYAPDNGDYLAAREITRQQIVQIALQNGNEALRAGRRVEAMAEFRSALSLDPENEFVRQRVRDVLGDVRLPPVRVLEDAPGAGPIRVAPTPGLRSFHIRNNSREVLEQVARAYGLTAQFDDSLVSRVTRFDVEGVDFARAMAAAMQVTKTFYVPLSPKQIYFLADTQQNRQAFERMVTRTFYIPDAGSPQELNDVVNVLRIMFDIRFLVQQPSSSTLTLRAPALVVEAATKFLESIGDGRPQVMFEIDAFEISRTFTRRVGVQIPLELQVFNVPTEAQKLLGGRSIDDIINELIASGLINQGNTTAIAALIAQFLGQQSSPLIGNTLLLFGGGITQSAIPIPPATWNFSANESSVRTLERVNLRAGQGTPAIFKVGSRVPIINASFAPIFNSPALAQVIQNQSFQAPFPSFQYEDVGVNIKATPLVGRSSSVRVDMEMQIRALGVQNLNGLPVISNREYKGTMSVKDGEKIVVAGILNRSEQRGIRGVPLLSNVPVLGRAVSTQDVQDQESELLIVLTPHIIRRVEERGSMEIPMPTTGIR